MGNDDDDEEEDDDEVDEDGDVKGEGKEERDEGCFLWRLVGEGDDEGEGIVGLGVEDVKEMVDCRG